MPIDPRELVQKLERQRATGNPLGGPNLLDQVLGALKNLPDETRKQVVADAKAVTADMVWVPNPGPQTAAYMSEADELFYGGQAGGGKAIACTKKIPTPHGFKQIGDIHPGDVVFAPDGTAVSVVAVSGVFTPSEAFDVEFDTGEIIRCDARHLWCTLTEHDRNRLRRSTPEWRARRRANRASRAKENSQKPWLREAAALSNSRRAEGYEPPPVVATSKTTRELYETLRSPRGALNHSIELTAPLQLPCADLQIDPYMLGLWLGDGSSREMRIAKPVDDMAFFQSQHGETPTSQQDTPGKNLPMRTASWAYHNVSLDRYNLRNNKHIPVQYLRASVDQRIALLQGLMDTDGTINSAGMMDLTLSNETLLYDAHELVCSLGCRATVTTRRAKIGDKDYGTAWRLKFTAPFNPFRLPRKAQRYSGGELRSSSQRRFIKDVRPCAPEPMQCIQVDRADGLFLVGRSFITTHNSDLGLGLALTRHKSSLVLRRFTDDAKALAERMMEITGTRKGWNGQDLWYRHDSRRIDFGGCKEEQDKQRHKGIPHDLIFWDEIPDFLESQYKFICAWNRSADASQRCRIVCTGNPPTTAEGLWVIKHWAAWLDPNHPNPAQPGELRWYTTVTVNGDDAEIEVDGPGPHNFDGKPQRARSRTFIPATLQDNPDLAEGNYGAVLDALPPELRRAYRDGQFDAALKDKVFQVIPTEWVRAARARWQPDGHAGRIMSAIAVDPAGGGDDPAAIGVRYGGWIGPLETVKGPETTDGSVMTGHVIRQRRHNCDIVVDVGGGYAGAMLTRFKDNELEHCAFNGAEDANGRAQGSNLKFANMRAQAMWRLREALDPAQAGGSVIALPPDDELQADLTAPTWTMSQSGILIESKKELRKRLGRSTNKGDVVAMLLTRGVDPGLPSNGMMGDPSRSGAGRGRLPSEANRGRAARVVHRRR